MGSIFYSTGRSYMTSYHVKYYPQKYLNSVRSNYVMSKKISFLSKNQLKSNFILVWWLLVQTRIVRSCALHNSCSKMFGRYNEHFDNFHGLVRKKSVHQWHFSTVRNNLHSTVDQKNEKLKLFGKLLYFHEIRFIICFKIENKANFKTNQSHESIFQIIFLLSP